MEKQKNYKCKLTRSGENLELKHWRRTDVGTDEGKVLGTDEGKPLGTDDGKPLGIDDGELSQLLHASLHFSLT